LIRQRSENSVARSSARRQSRRSVVRSAARLCPRPEGVQERDPSFPHEADGRFQQIGNSGAAAHWNATTLAVVLPHELRHFSGLDGRVDADGSRGLSVSLAVLTHYEPSTVGPLDDLGMVDFSHYPLQPLILLLANRLANTEPSHSPEGFAGVS